MQSDGPGVRAVSGCSDCEEGLAPSMALTEDLQPYYDGYYFVGRTTASLPKIQQQGDVAE